MPLSIKKSMSRDVISTLDPDIEEVTHLGDGMIGIRIDEIASYIQLTEQDLLTLLEFLRSKK